MEAYVTLATTDGYSIGALVLAHSLRSQGTTKQLCVLVTPGVTAPMRNALAEVFHDVVCVDVMDSNDSAHLALMERPELGVTFTKLHCWTLVKYSKCVFLDADILAVQNPDALFKEPEFSAASDVGWPDCFNSGMFVFVPSIEKYTELLDFARNEGSFDGGDQGLLNAFFEDWNRVSFQFNMVASATYTYLPAFKRFGKDVKLVHFLGSTKPWHGERAVNVGTNVTYQGYLEIWWSIYNAAVKPIIPALKVKGGNRSETSSGSRHAVSADSVPHKLASQLLAESKVRWESGRPDYMGLESFDNIMAYIDAKIQNGDQPPPFY